MWVARLGHALLFRLLLADHADRRPDRDAQEASRLHRPIRARRYRRGPCRVRTTMRIALRSRPGSAACWRCRRRARRADRHHAACRSRTWTSRSKARSAPMTAAPCSAASRSTRKSARPATASTTSPSTIWTSAGGPGFTEAQAKAIAAGYKIPAEPNDKGETTDDKGNRLTRPGILADHFPPPFPNEEAARANNGGALPPDLSHDRQGARRRRRTMSIRSSPASTRRRRTGFKVTAGQVLQPLFRGLEHLHAAAADRRMPSPIPTAPRRPWSRKPMTW